MARPQDLLTNSKGLQFCRLLIQLQDARKYILLNQRNSGLIRYFRSDSHYRKMTSFYIILIYMDISRQAASAGIHNNCLVEGPGIHTGRTAKKRMQSYTGTR